jgi:hypothetical protein
MKRVSAAAFVVIGLVLVAGCRQPAAGERLGVTYEKAGRPEAWKVPPRTQAAQIGMAAGDVVLAYGDEPIHSYDDLVALETLSQQTEPIQVAVMRDEQELTLTARPGPLGFVPVAVRQPGSLARALDDVTGHFGLVSYYDWLAALTGESFTLVGRLGECRSWWPGGADGAGLEEIGKLVGLSFRQVFGAAGPDSTATPVQPREVAVAAIRDGLVRGQVMLVRGGWANGYAYWGIPVRYSAEDSMVYGYGPGSAEEQPLAGEIVEVYEVRRRAVPEPDPADLLGAALNRGIELGLAVASTGWRSGLDAYDALIQSLDTVPFCTDHPEQSIACFHKLLWAMVASRTSANRFLDDMKEALPEQAELLDEITGANRVIISKLEGIIQSGLGLTTREDRVRVQMAINEIQLTENELLGFYEELLGEL